MSETLTKGYHFFRLQVEVPPDGNLQQLIVQLCVEEVYYAVVNEIPDYTVIKAKVPNSVKIITLDNVVELNTKYPGLVDAMRFLQQVAIQEGVSYLENEKNQVNQNESEV